MGFVELKCPNCGAKIQLDNTREFGFCSYCGTKLAQEKIIVEHRGKIAVDGIAEKDALLERGFGFIKEGQFEQAASRFDRALDVDPHCYDAYLGKLMCDVKVRTVQGLSSYPIPLDVYPSYHNALKYADVKQRQFLKNANQTIVDRINAKKRKSLRNWLIFASAVLLALLVLFGYTLSSRRLFLNKSNMIEYVYGQWQELNSNRNRFVVFDADGDASCYRVENGKKNDFIIDSDVKYRPLLGTLYIDDNRYILLKNGTIEKREIIGYVNKFERVVESN